MKKIYVDAAFKDSYAAGAFVIYDGRNQQIERVALPNCRDNHEAEFLIVIEALKFCLNQKWQHETILLFSDSSVVVKACQRKSAKNEWQKPFVETLVALTEMFTLLLIDWYADKDNPFPHQLAQRQLLEMMKLKR